MSTMPTSDDDGDVQTIQTHYECPVGRDCDDHPAEDMREHLITKHSLEERVKTLLKFAETTYEH